ncbi:MAG: hypothetical protein E5X34_13080 [Mesorhizobium sp.]|uniref:hypothetical protein n=1 Tax=Mesorhizobium sp. TaxID=1871066 RepID=UPI001220CE51|nr:hypothetical protein [Mesorhizobium sp.]TIR23983.1 MAG: hypothetical protein E5X34_13080 [Mesorhizobium sp.]
MATLVLAAHAWADEESTSISKPFFGCTDLTAFKDGLRLLKETDIVAFKKLIRERGCHEFNKGEKTFRRQLSEDALYACIRPEGEPDCFWTLPDLTTK